SGGASGVALSGPPLPAGPDRPEAPQRDAPATPDAAPPREADRIAPTPAPEAPALPEAETARPETRPADEPADTPAEPAAAPPEAATEIVTEADETSDEAAVAPSASALPVGRPRPPAPRAEPEPDAPSPPETAVAEAEPEPEPEPEPETPAASEPASEPERTAEAAPSAPEAGRGPPVPAGAVTGVRDAVSGFWNTAQVLRLERPEELVVTVVVPLGPDGKLAGGAGAVRTDPASPPDGRWKIAIDAARRAAIRAASAGFDLPPESYERWKTLELVFRPGSDFAGVQL
ncbi:MAG: hypothetical protein R6V44_01935, partial [Paracoccaceae bacterium]